MLIGVDFDNTIVCYDALFHKVAREGNFIPADIPVNKSDVRNYLRRIGKEEVWTEMQGSVYGGRMSEAVPYPGVLEFFRACRAAGIQLRIVSHKTRHPFLGEKYDLHKAATDWLEQQGFFDAGMIGLPREHVFFELTKQEKLNRIGQCGCTHFIDDLPEFLGEASFPAGVARILFDPNNLYGEERSFHRVTTWDEAQNFFFPPNALGFEADQLKERITPLLRTHGFRGAIGLEPLTGGGNNRVYQFSHDGKRHALKLYFQHPTDQRDRFGAEKAFYSLVWQEGVPPIPQPILWDDESRLGLFEFVEGRKLKQAEVDVERVREALDFILALNRFRECDASKRIPFASEACFSIAEHLDCVERRVRRLQKVVPVSEIDQDAVTFLNHELEPAWKEVRELILNKTKDLNLLLPPIDRCLSPSDFGFHNALLTADNQLRFFDFEYAGWDDPAKLVCDFFCQPQLPVGGEFWRMSLEALAVLEKSGAHFAERAATLLPAYQIKWCCIMLNEFILTGKARRDFAKGTGSAEERKKIQLEKARVALGKRISKLPFASL